MMLSEACATRAIAWRRLFRPARLCETFRPVVYHLSASSSATKLTTPLERLARHPLFDRRVVGLIDRFLHWHIRYERSLCAWDVACDEQSGWIWSLGHAGPNGRFSYLQAVNWKTGDAHVHRVQNSVSFMHFDRDRSVLLGAGFSPVALVYDRNDMNKAPTAFIIDTDKCYAETCGVAIHPTSGHVFVGKKSQGSELVDKIQVFSDWSTFLYPASWATPMHEFSVALACMSNVMLDAKHDELYVSSFRPAGVFVYGTDGRFHRAFGADKLAYPRDIVLHPNTDEVIVADSQMHCLQVFTRMGQHLYTVGGQVRAAYGHANLDAKDNAFFCAPTGLYVCPDTGHVLVADHKYCICAVTWCC